MDAEKLNADMASMMALTSPLSHHSSSSAREILRQTQDELCRIAKELTEAKGVVADYQNQLSELGLRVAKAENDNERLQAEAAAMMEAIAANCPPGKCGHCPGHWTRHSSCWVSNLPTAGHSIQRRLEAAKRIRAWFDDSSPVLPFEAIAEYDAAEKGE